MHRKFKRQTKKSKSFFRRRGSRGIDMLDYMELYIEPPVIDSHISITEKLRALLKHQPNNPFYKSLLAMKTPLNKGQKDRVNLYYNLNVRNGRKRYRQPMKKQ